MQAAAATLDYSIAVSNLQMWHRVKAANSHLSLVTEIGAIIGSMWRELDADKKEHYNELFSRDKVSCFLSINCYMRKFHGYCAIRERMKMTDFKLFVQTTFQL